MQPLVVERSVSSFPQDSDFRATRQLSVETHAQHIGRAASDEFLFIHTIRFWSMVAIVGMHSFLQFPIGLTSLPPICAELLIQSFKFGTICFFLVSGFLMGKRLPSCEPLSYLRRRSGRLLGPWLFWLMIFVLAQSVTPTLHAIAAHQSGFSLLHPAWASLLIAVRFTSYWFVPNLLIAMVCLLVFRKRLHDPRVGVLLLAVNLFYVANLYGKWLPTPHTEATFAYAFHLWLGAWCALHFEAVQRFARRIPAVQYFVLIGATCALAIVESHALAKAHTDTLNTLRLSNQLFSVVVALALFRVPRRTWPKQVEVRKHTYGVYLVHPILLWVFSRVFDHQTVLHGRTGYLLGGALTFVSAYSGSLLTTIALSASATGAWLVTGEGSPGLHRPRLGPYLHRFTERIST